MTLLSIIASQSQEQEEHNHDFAVKQLSLTSISLHRKLYYYGVHINR